MLTKLPGWKIFLAIFSLLLTILIWQRGLQDSFDRPSVNPRLNLNQREIALLAAPSIPEDAKPFLIGEDPKYALKETLLELKDDQLGNREKLLLAVLEEADIKRKSLLSNDFKEPDLNSIRKTLLKYFEGEDTANNSIKEINLQQIDPLLYRLSCLSIAENSDICLNSKVSKQMAFRLLFSQCLPLGATLLGIVLFIRQAWIYVRKKNSPWPELSSLPLSTTDLILLIAGGFVVLGELVTPLIAMPLGDVLFNQTNSPLKESLKVFLGYAAMTLPPLLILRQQIRNIEPKVLSNGLGLFQWGWKLFPKSLLDALKGWLMVMPFVLLVSWLTTFFFGDPGGSNPLLEMVLSSKNGVALIVLCLTTVLMAPFFEEFIFRGVLLPALVKQQGKVLAVTLSALIFALAHLSVGETPPLFVLGVGLALLRLSSGRLLPCVIMHSLWNGITFVNLLILSG